eukprot:CAMPEP_0198138884 /NCGR_PEP_ID=MMETSP1443-20131203/2273_1 /TAXON_ID=186043 /ORGANISM="Entomoneis sp., Strain CCMP2396" /LENGTH=35 /DNA_ID= /DNA_START= /DNA_END= /DNA_ORIENTATION=
MMTGGSASLFDTRGLWNTVRQMGAFRHVGTLMFMT